MSGFAAGAAGAAGMGAGFAGAPPPFRVTDSSTVKLSSRSLAATFLAVSASLNAPTCTQNGPVPAGAFAVVVAVVAARFGVAADLAATAGFVVSALATTSLDGVSAFGNGVSVFGAGIAVLAIASGFAIVSDFVVVSGLVGASGLVAVSGFAAGAGLADGVVDFGGDVS